MEFARKHLPDKFFMEGDQRKSLRNIITREMIANTLIHREYTSPYQAKFVIEKDRMYVENATGLLRMRLLHRIIWSHSQRIRSLPHFSEILDMQISWDPV